MASSTVAHMSIWTTSMYGVGWHGTGTPFNTQEGGYFSYDTVDPVAPLGPDWSNQDDWWFRGPAARALKPSPGSVEKLPAGGQWTVQIACHVAWTSYGVSTTTPGSLLDACPGNPGAYHSGDPAATDIDRNLLSGCALGIADVDDISKVTIDNLAIFSVKHSCVAKKFNTFDIPAAMPACTGKKCICGWFWLANNGTGNFYMTAFDCAITGAKADALPIAAPKDPVWCAKKDTACMAARPGGAKRPLYVYNSPSNIVWKGNDDRPGYHANWGFPNDGAQNDIFVNASSVKSSSAGASLPTASQASPTTAAATPTSPAASTPASPAPTNCAPSGWSSKGLGEDGYDCDSTGATIPYVAENLMDSNGKWQYYGVKYGWQPVSGEICFGAVTRTLRFVLTLRPNVTHLQSEAWNIPSANWVPPTQWTVTEALKAKWWSPASSWLYPSNWDTSKLLPMWGNLNSNYIGPYEAGSTPSPTASPTTKSKTTTTSKTTKTPTTTSTTTTAKAYQSSSTGAVAVGATTATTTTTTTTSTTTSSAAPVQTTAAAAVNLALQATASGSSYRSGSEYSKLIDGNTQGLNDKGAGSVRVEWISRSQTVGAWVRLTWKSTQTFNQVVLYDRPLSSEQITAGVLIFDGNLQVPVGSLNKDGAATTINFTPIQSKTVTFFVIGTNTAASAVGLSELQVFNQASTASLTRVMTPQKRDVVNDFMDAFNEPAQPAGTRHPRDFKSASIAQRSPSPLVAEEDSLAKRCGGMDHSCELTAEKLFA
ncbi:BQ5605_C008g05129 [Microbotryum silenes-dioicae]|uniref:BQ5605_C008g05129 protein n=1 Tax=Microbotryum silenes-dioicae TaxID=796604 RepID=A0A2X0PDW5_9BASI|nr:BQ5605_C008g05129 [Microbotryum silenes-dioicae]